MGALDSVKFSPVNVSVPGGLASVDRFKGLRGALSGIDAQAQQELANKRADAQLAMQQDAAKREAAKYQAGLDTQNAISNVDSAVQRNVLGGSAGQQAFRDGYETLVNKYDNLEKGIQLTPEQELQAKKAMVEGDYEVGNTDSYNEELEYQRNQIKRMLSGRQQEFAKQAGDYNKVFTASGNVAGGGTNDLRYNVTDTGYEARVYDYAVKNGMDTKEAAEFARQKASLYEPTELSKTQIERMKLAQNAVLDSFKEKADYASKVSTNLKRSDSAGADSNNTLLKVAQQFPGDNSIFSFGDSSGDALKIGKQVLDSFEADAAKIGKPNPITPADVANAMTISKVGVNDTIWALDERLKGKTDIKEIASILAEIRRSSPGGTYTSNKKHGPEYTSLMNEATLERDKALKAIQQEFGQVDRGDTGLADLLNRIPKNSQVVGDSKSPADNKDLKKDVTSGTGINGSTKLSDFKKSPTSGPEGSTFKEKAFNLIAGKEGFRDKAYYDVNAYRTGFGSDTITLADGTVKQVDENTTITKEDAVRDLNRRIDVFTDEISNKVGDDTFNKLDDDTKASVLSVVYNYGMTKLPKDLETAIKTGDKIKIADSIITMSSHNKGINAQRRYDEANPLYSTNKGNNERKPGTPEHAALIEEIRRAMAGEDVSLAAGSNESLIQKYADSVLKGDLYPGTAGEEKEAKSLYEKANPTAVDIANKSILESPAVIQNAIQNFGDARGWNTKEVNKKSSERNELRKTQNYPNLTEVLTVPDSQVEQALQMSTVSQLQDIAKSLPIGSKDRNFVEAYIKNRLLVVPAQNRIDSYKR